MPCPPRQANIWGNDPPLVPNIIGDWKMRDVYGWAIYLLLVLFFGGTTKPEDTTFLNAKKVETSLKS